MSGQCSAVITRCRWHARPAGPRGSERAATLCWRYARGGARAATRRGRARARPGRTLDLSFREPGTHLPPVPPGVHQRKRTSANALPDQQLTPAGARGRAARDAAAEQAVSGVLAVGGVVTMARRLALAGAQRELPTHRSSSCSRTACAASSAKARVKPLRVLPSCTPDSCTPDWLFLLPGTEASELLIALARCRHQPRLTLEDRERSERA